MFDKIKWIFAASFFAAMAIPTFAAAQSPQFVGTWRGEITLPGSGGYAVVMDMEYVFEPNGSFSAMSTSHYGNGPAAGGAIGAVRSAGTFKVMAAQGLISFHADHVDMTQKVLVPRDETDRFQFLSPTTVQFQSMIGGPVMTFQRVQ